jgi:hypothetical protein
MSISITRSGMGEWGEGSTPEERKAFALSISDGGTQYEVMFVDAEESPWQHAGILGRILDRAEALEHPWKEELFHITAHMVEDDQEIKAYLEGRRGANV